MNMQFGSVFWLGFLMEERKKEETGTTQDNELVLLNT